MPDFPGTGPTILGSRHVPLGFRGVRPFFFQTEPSTEMRRTSLQITGSYGLNNGVVWSFFTVGSVKPALGVAGQRRVRLSTLLLRL